MIRKCPRCENEDIEEDHNFCMICGLPLPKCHEEIINGTKYTVCNECRAVHMANFECPNCRKTMRATGNKGLNEIADIIDQRQGVSTKNKNEEC